MFLKVTSPYLLWILFLSFWCACRLLAALPEVGKKEITSGKCLPEVPEIRQSICLIVRPIKVTLSLTTSTQSVQCILSYIYRGALRAPVYVCSKIHGTACGDVVKPSVSLISLTSRQMLCPISGQSSKRMLDLWNRFRKSSKAFNSLPRMSKKKRKRKTQKTVTGR